VSAERAQLKTVSPDLLKKDKLSCIQGQFQDHLPGMTHDPTGYLDQLPPQGGHGVMPSGLRPGQALEPQKEIVGNPAGAKKHRMGPQLPTGHPIQPKTALPLFQEILRTPPLVVPC